MPKGLEILVDRTTSTARSRSRVLSHSPMSSTSAIFEGYPVALEADELSVPLVSTASNRSQQIIDERFETIFGDTISDSALDVARLHFRKARAFIRGPSPDYENAAKEAVSSVESYLKTLTQDRRPIAAEPLT